LPRDIVASIELEEGEDDDEDEDPFDNTPVVLPREEEEEVKRAPIC
jgi:hypothetical protein